MSSSSPLPHEEIIKKMKKIFQDEIIKHYVEYKYRSERNAYFGISDDKSDPQKDYNELATCLRVGCEFAIPINNPEGKYDYMIEEGLKGLHEMMICSIDDYKRRYEYFFFGKRRATHEIRSECNVYLLTFYVIIPKQK